MSKAKPYIGTDGEVRELDRAFMARARRGRPELPEEARKKRVNLMLDPDVVHALRDAGNMSARANAILRKALGI
jgi:uncharacterized protein (DUF4415 family)